MGQLVVAAAGAVVGGFFGMPQVGWAIGAAIGGAAFAEKVVNEGPKVTDLQLQGASAGAMIPVHRGSNRTAGVIVWDSGLKPTRHEDTVGKGGGGVTNVTWTYAVDMAISLGEAPEGGIAGIRRVWADGKLIWSVADAGFDAALASSQAFRSIKVYPGTETQMPDPTMEEALGIGNVPAYRGQILVVIADFQTEKYGRRRPNFTFEVVEQSSTSGHRWKSAAVAWPDSPYPSADVFPSLGGPVYFRGRMWSFQLGSGKVFSSADARSWVQVGGASGVPDFLQSARITVNNGKMWAVARRYAGGVMTFHFLHSQNGRNWFEINVTGEFYTPIYNEFIAHQGALYLVPSIATPHVFRIGVDGVMIDVASWPAQARGLVSDGTWVYTFEQVGTSSTSRLRRSADFMTWEPAIEGDPALIGVVFSDLWVAGQHVYFRLSGGFTGQYNVWRIRTSGNTTSAPPALDVMGGMVGNVQVYISDVSYFRPTSIIVGAFGDFPVLYCAAPDNHTGTHVAHYAEVLTGTPKAIDELVTEICGRRGIDPAFLDLAAIAGDTVHGFSVTKISTGRALLEQLMKAAFFDLPEIDGKLRAVKRGGAAVAKLTVDDLGAREPDSGAAAVLELAEADPQEIPAQIIVYYRSTAQDYNGTTQDARREFAESVLVQTEELGIAMDDDTARSIAQRMLRAANMGRFSSKIAVPRSWCHLSPADVIEIDAGDKWIRARLGREQRSGGLTEFEIAVEDIAVGSSRGDAGGIYDAVASGQAPIANPATPGFVGATLLQMLDLPPLRDQDDDAGMYAALSGFGGAWPGATLYKSSDAGATWQSGAAALSATATGVVETVPGAWSGGPAFDRSSFVVRLQAGTLESYSQAAVINGAGAVLVGDEIMLYTTATAVDADRWRLSGLLRGMRGTESAIGTHVSGERFVVLSSAMLRVPSQIADIGSERLFRGVTFSQAVDSAVEEAITPTGRALRPFSPALLTAGRWGSAGDIKARWVRRARIGATMRNGVGVALGESTEAYEVEVCSDGTFSAVVRTISSTSAETIYTAAQQSVDFGSLQTTVHLRVYQLSAVVGRGDPAQATITI